jgi:protein gp37
MAELEDISQDIITVGKIGSGGRMSLKTSIRWADMTLNPISGCLNNCEYCYARRFAKRLAGRFGYPEDDPFEPIFHYDAAQKIENLKGHGKRVFLDSMGDWFSEGVKLDWISHVIWAIRQKPMHTFLVLTKRPDRIFDVVHELDMKHNGMIFPGHLWFGVSVTKSEDLGRIADLKRVLPYHQKFISFEPLMDRIDHPDMALSSVLDGIKWIIVGAETGNRKAKVIPEMKWVSELCWAADALEIPVFLKDNLKGIVGGPAGELRQEIPEEMIW